MKGFYYLATPYSKYVGGLEEAYKLACLATAECFKEGLFVFSPIACTHSVAKFGNLGTDADFWNEYNETMMSASCGLIVVRIEGWVESDGVVREIKWYNERGKEIIFRNPPNYIRCARYK